MTREIKPEILDELLSGLSKPDDLLGDDGLFRQLKKALIERALGAELTHELRRQSLRQRKGRTLHAHAQARRGLR